MGSEKGESITRNLAIAAVVVLGISSAVARAYEWRSLTSFSDARRMAVIDDTLYVVTSGGLLAITDAARPGRQYTNLSDLGTVDIGDIIQDAGGSTWVAGKGRLVRWDGAATMMYPVVDNEGDPFRLVRVVDDGDALWVGCDVGLILFSKVIGGGQIQDAFQLFDDLNPAPLVLDIAVSGDSIYLATSAGLATAKRTNHLALKSPANWIGYRYTDYPELGGDTIRCVAVFEGRVYVGTDFGLFWWNDALNSFTQMPFSVGRPVYQLTVRNDSLFTFARFVVGVVKSGAVSSIATPGMSGGARCGAVFQGTRWFGRVDGGLYYQVGTDYAAYPYTGLPDNDVVDVTRSPDNRLMFLFRVDGPYEQQGDQWVHWPVNVRSRGLAMQADRNGNFYVATFGAGMSRIGDTVAQFTALNSTLQEAGSVGSNYVVCFDLKITDNYFFGVNFEPRDDTRLAIAALDEMDSISGWTTLGVSDGLNGGQMVSVDEYNHAIAVGSGLAGVFYYYYGADPFNKADDTLNHYYEAHPNFRYRINSDVVRVVRFSPKGELWVGASLGISRFDLSIESFVEVTLPAGFGPDITALEFDSRGNAWIGAKNGLGRVDYLNGEITVYTERNSGLLADFVNNLTFDNTTGNLYVATSSGVSVVLSTIGPPTDKVAEAYAFPNPYVITSAEDLLNFNFSGNARLRIFTVAGELVAETAEPVWDGRNDSGEPVASGVYLFVLTDELGNVGRGKFLLVRK
ncbi:MAG: hypothetical protein AB1772_02145 [Candidatus Zixiibacteriota bacterium]